MRFFQLLDGAEVLFQQGEAEVNGLDYDSRRVAPGYAFVAMRGEITDGNRYIDAAIAAGAVAVVTDSTSESPRESVAWAQVTHGRRALARLSANFYGRPAEKLRITGITGTNGKTTTSFLLESILKAAGRRGGLVGTIEYHVGGEVIRMPHTTPEALELNRVFAAVRQVGGEELVMEVSSHALAQERVYGVPYDVAVFTNLTQDHLDYHRDMLEYFAAKQVLFRGCGTEPPRVAVINNDEEHGRRLLPISRKAGSKVITYGIQSGDVHAGEMRLGRQGTVLTCQTPAGPVTLVSSLIGQVNVYNLLAATAAALARDCELDEIRRGAAALQAVPGRFERVDCGQPFTVVVDYAHTDDALRNLTAVARDFVGAAARVIAVFGCGGDRDRSKRPLMAEAAARGSNLVVLTSDNPRSEDPEAIIADAVPGLQKVGVEYVVEPDRRQAITKAVSRAHPGDIVLIAGKGHEKTQTTREGVFPFDDVEVAREELARLGYGGPRASASSLLESRP